VPAAIGITVSLVYCRYHYVTDVIAGIAWALIAYRIAVWVYPRVRARSAPHFGPDAPAAVGRA
jgi:membrane-associated phospholipid phosphatase